MKACISARGCVAGAPGTSGSRGWPGKHTQVRRAGSPHPQAGGRRGRGRYCSSATLVFPPHAWIRWYLPAGRGVRQAVILQRIIGTGTSYIQYPWQDRLVNTAQWLSAFRCASDGRWLWASQPGRKWASRGPAIDAFQRRIGRCWNCATGAAEPRNCWEYMANSVGLTLTTSSGWNGIRYPLALRRLVQNKAPR